MCRRAGCQNASPGAGRSRSTSRRKRNSSAGRPRRLRRTCRCLRPALVFHQAAEILLVQADAGDRFHRALQFQQREGGRHQFEHHRAVFHLAAQPRDGGGQDAAMIEHHARAERRIAATGFATRPSRAASCTSPLRREARSAPALSLRPRPRPSRPKHRRARGRAACSDSLVRRGFRRTAFSAGAMIASIMRGLVRRANPPTGNSGTSRATACRAPSVRRPRASARDSRPTPRAVLRRASADAGRGRRRCRAARHNRDRDASARHPVAQAAFQRAVMQRIERTEGQGIRARRLMHDQHARRLVGDRHDGRRQADADDMSARRAFMASRARAAIRHAIAFADDSAAADAIPRPRPCARRAPSASSASCTISALG